MNRTTEIRIDAQNEDDARKACIDLVDIIDKYFNEVKKDLCEAQVEIFQDKSLLLHKRYFGNKMEWKETKAKYGFFHGKGEEEKEHIIKLLESEDAPLIDYEIKTSGL